MVDFHVTEFSALPKDGRASATPILDLNLITADAVLVYTATANLALDAATKYVRLQATARAHISVGAGAQTAVAGDFRMEAGGVVMLVLAPGADNIAVYDGVT